MSQNTNNIFYKEDIKDNSYSINKTNITDIDIIKKISNRLIIKKETNNTGKIYFDYADDNRIEITSDIRIWFYDFNDYLKEDSNGDIFINKNEPIVYIRSGLNDITEIRIGDLIFTHNQIAVITNVSINVIKIKLVYSRKPLKWNDKF